MPPVLVLVFLVQILVTSLGQGKTQRTDIAGHNKCVIDQLKAECTAELVQVKTVLSNVPDYVTSLSLTLSTSWSGYFTEFSNKADITPVSHLVNLESLEITGDRKLEFDIFLTYDNHTELKHLKHVAVNIPLVECSFSNIVKYAPSLEVLDLTDTIHFGYSNLLALVSDVNIPSLTTLKISNFQTIGTPGHNTTINITALFGGQIAHNVTYLDLSNNDIGLLTPSYITTLPNLRYLDVSHNILIMYSNIMIFGLEASLHKKLEVLNMTKQGDFRRKTTGRKQKQGYSEQDGFPFSGKFSAFVINCVNSNDNTNLSHSLHNNKVFCNILLCVLRRVIISQSTLQLLSEIPCSTLGNLVDLIDIKCIFGFKFPFLHSVKVFLLNDVDCSIAAPYAISGELCLLPSPIQKLGFSKNMKWLTGPGNQFVDSVNDIQFSGVNSILDIDLSMNGLRLKIPISHARLKSLEKINLEGNYIEIIKEDVCLYWPKLSHINLARNNLSMIPDTFFKTCYSLRHVDLSRNTFTEVKVTFNFPFNSSLKFLNLSHNQIELLPAPFIEQLDMINGKLNASLTVDISNNPLVCNCSKDALQFLYWLRDTNITLVKRDTIICFSKYGLTLAHNIDLNKLKNECYPSNVITIVTSVMSTVTSIAVILVCFMIHRYRWRIRKKRYDIQKWFSQRWNKKNNSEGDDELQWKYDAFVSYCAIDRFWVHDVLMRQLENVYGFKLCIHYRDFTPGETIVDEIVRNIRHSRKLIIILSDVSITRPWCQFELEVAMREAINRKTKIIVVKLDMKDLIPQDSTLVTILETQVYLEWCEKVEGQKLFWAKLVDLLYGRDDDGCSLLNCCCRSGTAAIEPDDVIQVYDNDDVSLIQ